jgi:hypothetical protein
MTARFESQQTSSLLAMVRALEQAKMSCKVRSTNGDRMQIGETKGIAPGADLVNPPIWLSANI